MKSYTMTADEAKRYDDDDDRWSDQILTDLGISSWTTEQESMAVDQVEIYHPEGFVAEVFYAPLVPDHILAQSYKYVILDDGQFRWPALKDCVESFDGDPMSDAGCTACPIPEELRPYIGHGIGSEECIALCARILERQAEETSEPFAERLGKEFAEYLKANSEIQNWSPLDQGDPLPSEDYVFLREEFGSVTEEMESAYRAGFNSVFDPIKLDD